MTTRQQRRATARKKQRTSLTRGEIEKLKELIAPYDAAIGRLQEQFTLLNQAKTNICGAYLAGLGINGNMNIDLATGLITQNLPAEQSANGTDPTQKAEPSP